MTSYIVADASEERSFEVVDSAALIQFFFLFLFPAFGAHEIEKKINVALSHWGTRRRACHCRAYLEKFFVLSETAF